MTRKLKIIIVVGSIVMGVITERLWYKEIAGRLFNLSKGCFVLFQL